MLSSLFIMMVLLCASFSSSIAAEESGGEGEGMIGAELSDQLLQNEKSSVLIDSNRIGDHPILAEQSLYQNSAKDREEVDAQKNTKERVIVHQSSNPEELPYGPPSSNAPYSSSENKGEAGEGANQTGGDYQKYIPDEYKHYANSNNNNEGQGNAQLKHDAHVNVEGGEFEFHHRSTDHDYGQQEEQTEQPQQSGNEPWRNYIPAPYRKYVPKNIPADEDQHHINHHIKHHKHHHEHHDEHHHEEEKEKKEPKDDHHHEHEKKEEEKKEKPHHDHRASEHRSEKESDRHHCKKEHDHNHKKHEKKHSDHDKHHHDDHKLFDSSTEPLLLNENQSSNHDTDDEASSSEVTATNQEKTDVSVQKEFHHSQNVTGSTEQAIDTNNAIPIEEKMMTNDNDAESIFSSPVWASIGVCFCLIIFASLIYYLIIDGLSRYRRPKELNQLIDDDIGRIPATAFEKSHLLNGEKRFYDNILKNEPHIIV